MKDHAALRQCERCGDPAPDADEGATDRMARTGYYFLCQACEELAKSGANPSHASLASEIVRLREQVRVLRAAAEKFVNKCDMGLRSEESYAEFKAALEATKL